MQPAGGAQQGLGWERLQPVSLLLAQGWPRASQHSGLGWGQVQQASWAPWVQVQLHRTQAISSGAYGRFPLPIQSWMGYILMQRSLLHLLTCKLEHAQHR